MGMIGCGDPNCPVCPYDDEEPEEVPHMRDCTCVGSCRGAEGLGVGWNCVVANGPLEGETPYQELQRLRAARTDKARSELVVKQEALSDAAAELFASLRDVVNAAVTVNDGCAICGGDLNGLPPHYDGCPVYSALTVLARLITATGGDSL
jgi:hypothetical protein